MRLFDWNPFAVFSPITGPAGRLTWFFFALVWVYAFVVALSAWRAAPPNSTMRRQAGYDAVAFGLRDLPHLRIWLYGILRLARSLRAPSGFAIYGRGGTS